MEKTAVGNRLIIPTREKFDESAVSQFQQTDGLLTVLSALPFSIRLQPKTFCEKLLFGIEILDLDSDVMKAETRNLVVCHNSFLSCII